VVAALVDTAAAAATTTAAPAAARAAVAVAVAVVVVAATARRGSTDGQDRHRKHQRPEGAFHVFRPHLVEESRAKAHPTSTKRTAPSHGRARAVSAILRRDRAFPSTRAYFPTFAKIARF